MPGRSMSMTLAIGDLGAADVLLDCDAGEVCNLLPETGESIEESRFAGVWRADERDSMRRESDVPLPEAT